MRRTAALQMAGAEAAKKQRKMFIKQQDKSKRGTYYVINKWPTKPTKPREDKYFRISDLLLDLDDMDSKHVRPSTEVDDTQALKKWSEDPKRTLLQRKLQKLENELNQSRLKAFQISSNPTNSWRLGSHDIFSAALGAPFPAPLINSSEGQQGSANISTAETRRDVLHLVCSENGIPRRAKRDDSLLLQWFQLRTQLTGPEQYSKAQLTKALQDQDSITGVRRLVSQCLSSNLNSISFHQLCTSGQNQLSKDVSSNIRQACENIRKEDDSQNSRNLLIFIGNLDQRLSARGDHIGGPLCGLGLRLSAEICKPNVTRKYLDMGFESDYWTASDQGLRDILHALETYLRHFGASSRSSGLDLYDRQELLKLLIGSSNQGATPESVRSLVLDSLESSPNGGVVQTALGVYRAYIVLLGHLGAVALLWQEWRSSATMVEKLAYNEELRNSETQPDAIVTETFQAAIEAAISVVAPSHDAVPTNLDLAGCTTLDFKSIENQDQNSWLGYQQTGAHPTRQQMNGKIRAALGLPLDGWMEAVRLLPRTEEMVPDDSAGETGTGEKGPIGNYSGTLL
ncbi:hypothetical protein FSARC_2785 [Fusarium sarcochroum]|uniref:Uncharacterized protein n=1 Tax=Fusarium sarcochroum TaxID=1208366 RepID=A0A8H4U5A5_9HYPO|nr:hypothetical protein FSARC_2785 [Fusarium sarcochroum]